MSRHAAQNPQSEIKQLTYFQGSVLNPDSVMQAAERVDAIIIAVEPSFGSGSVNNAERVFVEGQKNVNAAANANNRAHVVLISQIYITRPQQMPSYVEAIRFRGQGERVLRTSGLPYTIIRPGWLEDGKDVPHTIRMEQGDTGEGSIRREDVAEVCVQALYHPSSQNKTFEIYSVVGETASHWDEAFAALEVDNSVSS